LTHRIVSNISSRRRILSTFLGHPIYGSDHFFSVCDHYQSIKSSFHQKTVESSHCQFAVCQEGTSKPFQIKIQIQKSLKVYFDIERRKQRNKLVCPDWRGQSYKNRKRKNLVTKRRKSWGLITFSDLTPWHKMFVRQNLFLLQIWLNF